MKEASFGGWATYYFVLGFLTAVVFMIILAALNNTIKNAKAATVAVGVTVKSGIYCEYEGDIAYCRGNVKSIYYNGWRIK